MIVSRYADIKWGWTLKNEEKITHESGDKIGEDISGNKRPEIGMVDPTSDEVSTTLLDSKGDITDKGQDHGKERDIVLQKSEILGTSKEDEGTFSNT